MERIDTWVCPLCHSELILTPWANPSGKKPGFKLQCYGTDAVPHRMRIFLEGFRVDASFLPAPAVPRAETLQKSRLKELLRRAESLAA